MGGRVARGTVTRRPAVWRRGRRAVLRRGKPAGCYATGALERASGGSDWRFLVYHISWDLRVSSGHFRKIKIAIEAASGVSSSPEGRAERDVPLIPYQRYNSLLAFDGCANRLYDRDAMSWCCEKERRLSDLQLHGNYPKAPLV